MPKRRATRSVPEDLASVLSRESDTENVTTRPTEPQTMEVLVQALRALGLSGRDNYKAPCFSGEGDIELFLSQFEDVARANGWAREQETFHLKPQLHGQVQNCSRGQTKAEIVED